MADEPRYCVGCNNVFWSHKNATRCRKDCGRDKNATTKGKRAAHEVTFIGVDGEGINGWQYAEVWDDEEEDIVVKRVSSHEYVLLSVGDQSLHNGGKRLTWYEIFPFLWQQYLDNPGAAFVGFFLGYDFTHWFRDLPEHRAWKLLHKEGIASRLRTDSDMPRPWPVRVGQWEFDVLANKRFMLRPFIPREKRQTKIVTHKDGTQTEEPIARPWMYICDAGSFFQTSFLSAINPKDWVTPIVTPAEYAIIVEGKEHRSDAEFDTAMIKYNVLENDVLARVMATVNQGLVSDQIRLARQQWFGPGQAAQKWLALVDCPPGETIRETVPQFARDAARESYYGGWFEIFAHGIVEGESYAYDINSAYPYGISRLPCLLHGKWTQGSGAPVQRLRKGSLRLIDATIRGSNTLVGTMPHRRDDGSICRPRNTSGWYWWDELQAAKRAGIVNRVEITSWIDYDPCKCPPPLASIQELYEGRLQVGKNSPSGKGKKLIYNSAYGKLAQSIGQPKFTNPIYASRITSVCRTMILDAIATHPTKTKSLLMVATDSVVFKERHPTLNIHETQLGAWDETEHANLSLFMPGMYWDDTTRERVKLGESPKLKSRGVPATDLARWIAKIDRQWTELQTKRNNWRWPAVSLPVKFQMTTAKQAVVRGNWETCGAVDTDGFRELTANPSSKRDIGVFSVYRDERYGFIRTDNYEYPYPDDRENIRTTPYDKAFGETDDERNNHNDNEPITPDGTITGLLAQALIP